MSNLDNLRQYLIRLDNHGYKAYKDIQGTYEFSDFTLIIDRAQGDPFASPSQLRVQIPHTHANFPKKLYDNHSREIGLRDYLTRQFDRLACNISRRRGTGNSGIIAIAQLGQEILARNSVLINSDFIEVRFVVGLPASGRSILGYQAAEMLCNDLPRIIEHTFKYDLLIKDIETHYLPVLEKHIETVEDTDYLRQQLTKLGLVAFIPNGAILPRLTGVDPQPLQDRVIPFKSPESLQVELNCPNRGKITGMGIPSGITLIVGGGYHGKSTLLRAIALGIYNYIPGDGRELVVTNPAVVKIRAEDGRSIASVDISPFINHLPQGQSTTNFSTPNASGSTSQAANIIEALEAGMGNNQGITPLLLIDEDTAATNFMIRDRRMQELIAKDKEPITPFIDKVRQLYTDYGVSSILVMGGSGDYFEVADTVIAMENFQPENVTQKARAIAKKYQTYRHSEGGNKFGAIASRIPEPASIDPSRGKREVKLNVRDLDEVIFGTEDLDLSAVEQIVDIGQTKAIAAAMVYAKHYIDGDRPLTEILDLVMADIQAKGLDVLTPFPQGDLSMFRRFELAAALNRLRTLKVRNDLGIAIK